MFKNKYEADNSRFGEVLTQVLSAHGIGVRIVSAMREFIFNEAELLRVQQMLVKAAFRL